MATPTPTPLALLAALRDHLIKGRAVELQGEEAVFSDVNGQPVARHAKHAPTAYVSKSTKKPYDLLAVWLCYKFAHLAFVDYVAQCRTEKAAIISTVDKRELIAYLKGDIEVSAQILGDDGEPTDKGAAANGAEKRASAGAENGSDAHKKRKLDANKENKAKPASAATPAATAASAEDKEADADLKKILEKEYTHRNRTTVLNAAKKSFDHVLKAVEAANAETKDKIEKASKTALMAPGASTARKEQQPLSKLMQDKIHGTPIIVVPAGFSDLITMLNVKDFLVDGVYVSNAQKKSEGCRKAQSISITHEEDGETYTFNVVDNVTRFKDKDWRCVVAVIASGQVWQFKGWKWKFPVEVFKKVCGIHVYTQGSILSEEIKQWDVKILMIHPDKRHLDKVASKEFWRNLFEFLKLKLQ